MSEYQTLSSGFKIPSIGFGTAGSIEAIESALDVALEIGYRHIDTAPGYRSEPAIGRVLNKWTSSGKLKREDVFITSKINPNRVAYEEVDAILKHTLSDLQTNYIDLYLVHWPAKEDADNIKFWKKMEEQVDAGRTKYIGISNFRSHQIDALLKTARIKPVNLQIPLHLYGQQKEIVDYCNKNDITVVAYSPLGAPGRKSATFNILEDEILKKVANKYKKTPGQIALRFSIQRGIIPIPKSSNPERLKQNFTIFDFKLVDEDMKALEAVDQDIKGHTEEPPRHPPPPSK